MRVGCRVGLRIVLFEACSAFTGVTVCTLALSPDIVLSEGFSISSAGAIVSLGRIGCQFSGATSDPSTLCCSAALPPQRLPQQPLQLWPHTAQRFEMPPLAVHSAPGRPGDGDG
jgi:hypothetical protein